MSPIRGVHQRVISNSILHSSSSEAGFTMFLTSGLSKAGVGIFPSAISFLSALISAATAPEETQAILAIARLCGRPHNRAIAKIAEVPSGAVAAEIREYKKDIAEGKIPDPKNQKSVSLKKIENHEEEQTIELEIERF